MSIGSLFLLALVSVPALAEETQHAAPMADNFQLCSDEDEASLLEMSLLQTTLKLQKESVAAQAGAVIPASAGNHSDLMRTALASTVIELLKDGWKPEPVVLAFIALGILLVVVVLVLVLRRYASSHADGPGDSAIDWQGGTQIGIYGILVTQTLNALATMVVLPTMPFYAMQLGASAFEISLMNSAYNLAQMFCSPLIGTLSDRLGRKRVMVVGIACQAICNGFLCCSNSFATLMAARMAVGMALSTGPVEMAYIMDFVRSEKELSRVLALQRVMTSAGALAGPMVARSFDSLPFTSLCRGVVAINLLNLVTGILLWEDAPAKADKASKGKRRLITSLSDITEEEAGDADGSGKSFADQLRAMLSNHAALGLLLVSFVYSLGFGISDGPEMVFFKDRFGFGKDEACDFYMFTNVSTLVCSAWVPALLVEFGALALCIAGSLGGAACTLLLVFGPPAAWVPNAFGASMVGFFGTMVGLGFMHLVQKYCPEDLLGTMLGLQSSLNGAAGALAPPLGGMLYSFNMYLPFLCTSGFCAMTGVFYKLIPYKADALAKPEAAPKRKRPQLRRLSTFGKPIYNDTSFMVQLCTNELRVQMDPESRHLYERLREKLREEKVRGGLKPVATVAGSLAAAIEQDDEQEDEHQDLRRTSTTGRLA
eukprot:gb/GFBE01024117.1/.p1 GENE.gb/GFBE01024117.1/~~gb/GFBE01024117.1/.p1  ORF type:complete len:655 (+),score=150.33 gb/GFBE01024117.1/:1-1965(+)